VKIFISHSSYDKWVARQIARQLEDNGYVTFLDEKHIQTGEPIEAAVHANLADSDEVLILISTASLKSHWVFIEIGAARALQKHIIPILFHIQPNEIPQPSPSFWRATSTNLISIALSSLPEGREDRRRRNGVRKTHREAEKLRAVSLSATESDL
jgi:hypothetical protein